MTGPGPHHGGDHAGHTVLPTKPLLAVFGALVFLTIVTVITAQIDLGGLNIPLALTIATIKALLVVAIFMALRYDNPVNFLVLATGGVFVVVFLILTLSDTALRGALGIVPAGEIIATVAPPDAVTEEHDVPEQEGQDAGVTNAAHEDEPVDGEEVYTRYLCNTCHSLDGTTGVGPTMQGIGAQQSREQISESIRNPDAVIVEGFPAGIMGATLNAVRFNDTVTEAEFESLVEYLAGQ